MSTELVVIAAHEFLSPARLFREFTSCVFHAENIAYGLLPIAALTKAEKMAVT